MSTMLAYGGFIFSPARNSDYASFSHTASAGWITQPRAGQAPASQLKDRPLHSLSLEGQILGSGASTTLRQLRSYLNGPPRTLIRGDGQLLGQWLLLKVTERGSHLIDNGSALKTTFTLELREYRP